MSTAVDTALLVVGGATSLAGGAALFVTRRARHRLVGLGAMATGALLVLLSVVPTDAGALPAALVSLLTLGGLLLFARHLERRGTRQVGGDLDLDEDPAR